MEPTRRQLLGAVAASAALAGCLGSTSTDTRTGTDSPDDSATVRVRDHDQYGEILVDAAGATLYMFDSDSKGSDASACTGGCAEAWPPLTVDGDPTGGEAVTASLSTFERAGGATQVAAAGWPLYYFGSDESPGDAEGQAVQGVWWVLGPDGTPRRATPTATSAMADDDSTATATDDGYDDDDYPG